jgi:hypothetical protein
MDLTDRCSACGESRALCETLARLDSRHIIVLSPGSHGTCGEVCFCRSLLQRIRGFGAYGDVRLTINGCNSFFNDVWVDSACFRLTATSDATARTSLRKQRSAKSIASSHYRTYHDFDEVEVFIFSSISNALHNFSDVRGTVNDSHIDGCSSHGNRRFADTSGSIQHR